MINEIKTIVKNYLNTVDLCKVVIGIVTSDGVKISERLTIPMELISGNLKNFVKADDSVTMIRNLGGQEFFIAEIINFRPIVVATYNGSNMVIGNIQLPLSKVDGNLKLYLRANDGVRLFLYDDRAFLLEIIGVTPTIYRGEE